jgi:hypothetical protein
MHWITNKLIKRHRKGFGCSTNAIQMNFNYEHVLQNQINEIQIYHRKISVPNPIRKNGGKQRGGHMYKYVEHRWTEYKRVQCIGAKNFACSARTWRLTAPEGFRNKKSNFQFTIIMMKTNLSLVRLLTEQCYYSNWAFPILLIWIGARFSISIICTHKFPLVPA